MENLYLNNISQGERVCAEDGMCFDYKVFLTSTEDSDQAYIVEIEATDGWQEELSFKHINDSYTYKDTYQLILN